MSLEIWQPDITPDWELLGKCDKTEALEQRTCQLCFCFAIIENGIKSYQAWSFDTLQVKIKSHGGGYQQTLLRPGPVRHLCAASASPRLEPSRIPQQWTAWHQYLSLLFPHHWLMTGGDTRGRFALDMPSFSWKLEKSVLVFSAWLL